MINYVYQLIQPQVIAVDYRDLAYDGRVIIRPEYMSICKADMRYYLGQRDPAVLSEKLPMALIHECCARVVFDPTGQYKAGTHVIPVPNIPGKEEDGIYENYREDARFLSSGSDGFMQEFVAMDAERLVPYEGIRPEIAAVTEYISVAVHAVSRFESFPHSGRETIGIWGDGSLGFVAANVLKKKYPGAKLVIIGHNAGKLPMFSFADETYFADRLPEGLRVDHAFECVGGTGSEKALSEIIRVIRPQGAVMMMGVSESPVAIPTRTVLEKGLTLTGCSRSGKADFEEAIRIMKEETFQMRLAGIITQDAPVRSIEDIHAVFANDRNNPFKTVFKWEV